jgi:hypothetical protein
MLGRAPMLSSPCSSAAVSWLSTALRPAPRTAAHKTAARSGRAPKAAYTPECSRRQCPLSSFACSACLLIPALSACARVMTPACNCSS